MQYCWKKFYFYSYILMSNSLLIMLRSHTRHQALFGLTEPSGGLWILAQSTDGPFSWRKRWKSFLKPSKSFLEICKRHKYPYYISSFHYFHPFLPLALQYILKFNIMFIIISGPIVKKSLSISNQNESHMKGQHLWGFWEACN